MVTIPTLTTERLLLRPFSMDDSPVVKELAGEYEVAATTANIPHPYEAGMAAAWISTHQEAFEKGAAVTFAIALRSGGQLLGAIGLGIDPANSLAELGYWIGKPYWNRGYCTEAARAVLEYAFSELGLNRVQARHMTKNPASGRVMQKIGMQYEGRLRQQIKRWEAFQDAEMYAILREEYQSREQ
ncbi:MAG TPA: GNAT family N-acetyltransferase [Anaerolineales bacterium]